MSTHQLLFGVDPVFDRVTPTVAQTTTTTVLNQVSLKKYEKFPRPLPVLSSQLGTSAETFVKI